MGPKDINRLLINADASVQIVGVVGIDADWEEICKSWSTKIESGKLKVTVLCESDNMLFGQALLSDSAKALTRKTFRELKFIRDRALNIPTELRIAGLKDINAVDVQITYINTPISFVCIDGVLYSSVWTSLPPSKYIEHQQRDEMRSYFEICIDADVGRKYSASVDEEVLELFDHSRTPRGIYPRSSFYDTDYSQLVVWALVFDREGRLLIHRRADNAKDNQGMWDKSVGGHVDFSQDIDTARGILREVVEELYEDETSGGDNKHWAVSEEYMVYLGDWRPEKRSKYPFQEINTFKKEWAFFKLPKPQQVYSPRTLPDGTVKRLRVIADVFLFVASEALNHEKLKNLQNSEYKLVVLNDLKNVMDVSIGGQAVEGFDSSRTVPFFTPDLVNIMTGELREDLEEFSLHIKRYLNR